jgi:hypothetical protein
LRSTIHRHRWLTLVASLIAIAMSAGVAIPAAAADGSGAQVIADCNAHDTLTRTYSIAALEDALRTMPADVAEYTDCHDVIARAVLAQEGNLHRSGSSTGTSSGSSFLPTPLVAVLVVLTLAAAALGGLALRRRRGL